MGVGGGRCIEASHFNKGWFLYSASAVSLGVITVIRKKRQITCVCVCVCVCVLYIQGMQQVMQSEVFL